MKTQMLTGLAAAAIAALLGAPTATADSDFSDANDEIFLSRLATKGIVMEDLHALNAAYGACSRLENGEGSINTAAALMDFYDVSGPEAGQITLLANQVYCP